MIPSRIDAHTVTNVWCAGDEGGFVCHMTEAILTHVHMPRSARLAPTVADCQKHRVKKLKNQVINLTSATVK